MKHKIKSETEKLKRLNEHAYSLYIQYCPSNRIVSHLSFKYCCTMIGMGNNDFLKCRNVATSAFNRTDIIQRGRTSKKVNVEHTYGDGDTRSSYPIFLMLETIGAILEPKDIHTENAHFFFI